MGIYQKNYLFNPQHLVKALMSYHAGWTKKADPSPLAKVALELFKTIPEVRGLCDEYGSWDEKGLEIAYEENIENLSLWTAIIIYSHLIELSPGISWSGKEYEFVENLLLQSGVRSKDISRIIFGDPLTSFALNWFPLNLSFWKELKLPSTSSSIGYLGYSSINKIYWLLEKNQVSQNLHLEYIRKSLWTAKSKHMFIMIISSG